MRACDVVRAGSTARALRVAGRLDERGAPIAPAHQQALLPPALALREGPAAQRMLHVDVAAGRVHDLRLSSLPSRIAPGDVVVLNDAATLPASLAVRARGRELELRLAGARSDGTFRAVLFGEGTWRDDTDARPAPPQLSVGETLVVRDPATHPSAGPQYELHITVTEVDPRSPRLLTVRFSVAGDAFWRLLYRLGRPVQYRYHAAPLSLALVQTPFASHPVAVEPPSAGLPLTLGMLGALRAAGAELVTLTHAAGLSATGDPALDARLPFPERCTIPTATARALRDAAREGRRVLAVGTSVTRALEGVLALRGALEAGTFEVDLRLDARSRLQLVDGLLTGAHDPGSSHHALLGAFAPPSLLARALAASHAGGYRGHELGDSWLFTGARGRALGA